MSFSITDLAVSYGEVPVLRSCSLEAGEGELVCLVGPSGCGKTTLLKAIAGVVQPEAGSIAVGGVTVDGLPTRSRRLAFIMDRLGLYPHLSVFENIAYPLRIRKVAQNDVERRVSALAREVGLDGLERRRPHELSAGQQQRVAIARALIRDDAALILADESFSSLDAQLRYELRTAFRRWQRERGVTALFVTHDQDEALSLGDRVALMRDGRIEQLGTPMEVYRNPGSIFVAGFFGVPRCNLVFPGKGDGGAADLRSCLASLRPDLLPGSVASGRLAFGFRPESVSIAEAGASGGLTGSVEWTEVAGADSILHLEIGEERISARIRGACALPDGAPVGIIVDPGGLMLFDAETGRRAG